MLRFIASGIPHLRLDNRVSIRRNVATVTARQTKNKGLIPSTFNPPKAVTSNAPSIGANIPSIPMLKVSQKAIAVARSSFLSEFAQITAQFCPLVLSPDQYATIARIIIGQL